MSTITEYLTEAELALAAYATLTPGMSKDVYVDALQDDGNGMAQKQAAEFASHWRVIDQYNGQVQDSYYDDFGQLVTCTVQTGLSVTIFEEIGTGKQVVAVRGTQDLLDGITDLIDIVVLGTAAHQAQYAALTAQVRKWLDDGVLKSGFSATGHSLGGFLATNLSLDYAADATHVYLYNAPGLTGFKGNILGAITQALSPGRPLTISTSLPISNIVATSDPASLVGIYVTPPIAILIESNLNPIHNHRIVTLTDALAVYNLFARVDPTVSVETVSSIIKAASNQSANTLEAALSALGWVYFKTYPTGETSRDAFYTNVYDLQGVIGSNHGKVVSLTGQSRAQIATLAKTDIAYRHALEWLNPFVVTGNDALYTDQNADGHLDANRFSDLYLQDRAAMLTWKMQFDSGKKDADDLLPGDKSYDADWDTWSIKDDWKFKDMTRGITLTVDGVGGDTHNIVFGSGAADTITGDSKSDHLYGMAGNDTISGSGGDDHLEGGAGDDILQGGAGYDTYVWHTGDGNDEINDEREADGKVHGIIKIVNDQGQNVVVGGAYVQQGTSEVWVKTLPDNSGSITITNAAGEWTLTLADGSALTLGGFKDGDFGISLVEEGVDPATGRTIGGDREPAKFYTDDGSSWYYKYDDLGNIITGRYAMDANGNVIYVSNAEPGREDYLYDSAGNDRVEGLAGNDILRASRGGDDILDGGAGNDVGYGEAGKDLLLGGSGSDAMIGGADDDRLYADQEQEIPEVYLAGETGDGTGMRGDLLSGDAGEDQLFGGAGNDALAGGAGADIIYSGAGDDTIEGDQGFSSASASWGVTRTITQEGDHSVYTRVYQNASWYEPGSTEQGDDTIYAGAGNDWVFAQGGNDFVDAGIGDDVVFGEGGDDVILGQDGNDVLNGDSRNTPAEEQGDDYLDGGEGNDKLWGGGGADILLGGAGSGNKIFGEVGNDEKWRLAA